VSGPSYVIIAGRLRHPDECSPGRNGASSGSHL